MKTTKRILSVTTALMLCLGLMLGLCACNSTADETPTQTATQTQVTEAVLPAIWADAMYTDDTTLGTGKTQVNVKVTADEKSVTFTINTDAKTLGDALLENNLIEGEESEYGLYVKKVNGMLADYDADQTYWAMYKDSEYLMTGVDATDIKSGEQYEIVYSK